MPDYEKIRNRTGPSGARWVCVFGTSDPQDEAALAQAEQVGTLLASRGWVTVTGGYQGVMEGANRAARSAGGFSVGVTCSMFSRDPNPYLDHVVETDSLLVRLESLLRLGDGYVACKGGTGTLAEISLAWEYINKRIVPRRPLVLLGEFWQRLPEIISDQSAAPGVSIGRAGGAIGWARDPAEAMQLLEDGFSRLETASAG